MVGMLQNPKTGPTCNRSWLSGAVNIFPGPYHALLVYLWWDILIFIPKQYKNRRVCPRRMAPYLAQASAGEIRGEKVVIPLSLSMTGSCRKVTTLELARELNL
jgi:hypothetical protein